MREIGIFFGNVRKNINTNVTTLGDFIALLKDQDIFDGDLSSNTILERYSFMKPSVDGSEIELDFQSLNSSLPQEDFKIFISTKKTKFGGIEDSLENIEEKVIDLEYTVDGLDNKVNRILEILEDSNNFSSVVPSSQYTEKEEERVVRNRVSDSLENAYRKFNRG